MPNYRCVKIIRCLEDGTPKGAPYRAKRIALLLVVCLSACTTFTRSAPYSLVYAGAAAKQKQIIVEGVFHSFGRNYNTLYENEIDTNSQECISLILPTADIGKRDFLEGKKVKITGKLLYTSDLISWMTPLFGRINERYWEPTGCKSEITIFVNSIWLTNKSRK